MTLPKKILVPLDLSEPSREAAEMAIAWAKQSGAVLHLFHVIDARQTTALAGYGMPATPLPMEDLQSMADEGLERFVSALDLQGVPCTRARRLGLPAEEILEEVQRQACDLIVMATHGRSGVRRLLIGSETEAVIRASEVPVLVVKASGTSTE